MADRKCKIKGEGEKEWLEKSLLKKEGKKQKKNKCQKFHLISFECCLHIIIPFLIISFHSSSFVFFPTLFFLLRTRTISWNWSIVRGMTSGQNMLVVLTDPLKCNEGKSKWNHKARLIFGDPDKCWFRDACLREDIGSA